MAADRCSVWRVGHHQAWELRLGSVNTDSPSPVLELQPTTARFLPDGIRRLRSNPRIGALLIAALAGLGAAIAFGHTFASEVVAITLGATALAAIVFVLWFVLTVFGARWTVYADRLVLTRPGAKTLEIPLLQVASIRLESISGFGMQDPIYVFLDSAGSVLFWTVANRWDSRDLELLWKHLDKRPVSAMSSVVDYQSMPYGRRY